MVKKGAGISDSRKTNNTSQEIGAQVLSVLLIIGELLLLWVKFTIEMCISIYRTFIPVPAKSVKGEIVMVTGAGHGIGKELALQFAALEATVICMDINKKNNEQTVKDIAEHGYTKAYSYECDVSNRVAVLDLAKKIQAEVGNVTILINNAGIMPTHSLQKHTEKEIRSIFDINVFAHFWLLEAYLPAMLAKNHGHIVALSSMAGVIGIKNLVPYCASKFAVRGMMEALHEELRETVANTNIKFTCIYPYMVDTGLCKKPIIRFPSLLPIVSPKQVAAKIVNATRRNVQETSIPEYMYPINNFLRMFPTKCSLLLKDFIDSGLDSDL